MPSQDSAGEAAGASPQGPLGGDATMSPRVSPRGAQQAEVPPGAMGANGMGDARPPTARKGPTSLLPHGPPPSPGITSLLSFPQQGAAPQLPSGPPHLPGATSLLDRPLARCAASNLPPSAQQVPATTAPLLPHGPPPSPGATTMLGQTDTARGENRQPGGSTAGPQSHGSQQGSVPVASSSRGQGSSWPRARALPQRTLLQSSARVVRKRSTPSVAGGAPLAPAVAPLSFGALPKPPKAPPNADWGSLSRYYVGAWPGPSRRSAPPSGSSVPPVPSP